jgi:hypothetical protein
MLALRVVENHDKQWDRSLQQSGINKAFPLSHRSSSRLNFFNDDWELFEFMECLEGSLRPATEPLNFMRSAIVHAQVNAEKDLYNSGIDASQWEYAGTLHQQMREAVHALMDLSWPKVTNWSQLQIMDSG